MYRKVTVLVAVVLLGAAVATPAAARKGGFPGGPPSSGLEVTVEPTNRAMWANSVGDAVPFDITVTNNTPNTQTAAVAFMKDDEALKSWTADIEGRGSWSPPDLPYSYTVVEPDFDGKDPNVQSSVRVGTVTVSADGVLLASADAIMTAYPVPVCPNYGQLVLNDPPLLGTFTFGPNPDYAVCAFRGTGYWTLTTQLAERPHGRNYAGATVRDGVPGNWCDYDESGALAPSDLYGQWMVDNYVYLSPNGVCLGGGAGGDTIPVRNHDLYYLATWAGNVVRTP